MKPTTYYPGGYWWPPTYSNRLKTFFWQLTIFSHFSGPKLPGPIRSFFMIGHLNYDQCLSLSPLNEAPHQYLSNELSCTLNEDRMQNLQPREVDVLTYPNGAHMTFGASSPRVRFLDVYGFGIHVYCKNSFRASLYSSSCE
jgi:hypothetical protein